MAKFFLGLDFPVCLEFFYFIIKRFTECNPLSVQDRLGHLPSYLIPCVNDATYLQYSVCLRLFFSLFLTVHGRPTQSLKALS